MKWLIGLLTLCLCVHTLKAENGQPLCIVQITNAQVNVNKPDRLTDYWTCEGSCSLSNGFYACWPKAYWLYESQAEDQAKYIAEKLTGAVSLEYGEDLIFKYPPRKKLTNREFNEAYRKADRTYFLLNGHPIKLSIRSDANFAHLPKIVSIKEDVKEVDDIGWFYSGRKNLYSYLIELSDGTCWMTKEQNTRWVEYDRFINDCIMALGTDEEACLIRLAPGQTGMLNSGNCLTNMHRVK